jgi:Fic-DOC domain mobile mystery protein B
MLSELNEFENQNIAKAMVWLQKTKTKDVVSPTFLIGLHKRMFGDVWKWAGVFRTSDKNIGAPWFEVPEKVKVLLDDVRYWLEHKTYSLDEIGVRFHHRLVSIHPFPNGNGRHARLFCDALLQSRGGPPFSWGKGLGISEEIRVGYLDALRAADNKDISLLVRFVRT